MKNSTMKQEEKELLFKDLCARLPYGVMLKTDNVFPQKLEGISFDKDTFVVWVSDGGFTLDYMDCKPYLFPLSSMTEEQCYDFYCKFVENEIDYDDFKKYYFDNGLWHKLLTSIDDCNSVVDWFNKNNIDYRGLIPIGLANDATNLNIY